ncbi:MAG: hypothetical protein K5770_15300, partial [Lachnospiraceae bacterium]|nr:hypothetical protein [Lachnospiraceae bacterium]
GEEGAGKPVADEFLMESIYEGLREAAEAMDCDMADEIMKEIEPYAIPDSEIERFKLIREKVDMLDYEGILDLIRS